MKSPGAHLLFAAFLAGSGVAAELAPASAQYDTEGAVPAAPAPPPRVLPKTVWPRVELADGRVLQKARAAGEDALSVTFMHSEGITKVDRRLLPAELAAVFPFDPAEAARAHRAQAAEREASAAAQKGRDAESRREARVRSRLAPGPTPPAANAGDAIPEREILAAVVRARAKRYFENEKRTGSGATLVFGFITELEDPEPVSGWPNRWEIEGVASYKIYDSFGWGSFSARTQEFRALIEAPPGKTPKVVSFDER